jgi:hypothetical protein
MLKLGVPSTASESPGIAISMATAESLDREYFMSRSCRDAPHRAEQVIRCLA